MACLVCDHPKRWQLEEALRNRKSKNGVAKEYGIARSTLQYHLEKKHEEKNPAKKPIHLPPDIPDDFPNDHTIRCMESRAERQAHVDRLLTSRLYKGTETIAYLARLWRRVVGNKVEEHVCELVANAARKHKIARGPKDVRKELHLIRTEDLYAKCYDSGDYKTCATLIDKLADLDNLKDDSAGATKLYIAQIVQIVKEEAPALMPRIEAVSAEFEAGYEQAKAIVDGEIVPPSPALPVHEEPPAPETPRSQEAGIDSGIR
jgi:hypothetical protein